MSRRSLTNKYGTLKKISFDSLDMYMHPSFVKVNAAYTEVINALRKGGIHSKMKNWADYGTLDGKEFFCQFMFDRWEGGDGIYLPLGPLRFHVHRQDRLGADEVTPENIRNTAVKNAKLLSIASKGLTDLSFQRVQSIGYEDTNIPECTTETGVLTWVDFSCPRDSANYISMLRRLEKWKRYDEKACSARISPRIRGVFNYDTECGSYSFQPNQPKGGMGVTIMDLNMDNGKVNSFC